MANTLLTISMITREALRVLENNLKFAKLVRREYDDQFAQDGAKIGATLNIRKPPRYLGRSGATLSVEDSVESYATLTLDTQFGVDINFTSKELALDIDDFSDRFLKPACAVIANKIDYDGLALYKYVANCVGTPGTTPSTLKTYMQANGALDDEACPMDGLRAAVINPDAQIEIVDALKGLFQDSGSIAEQYRSGRMGHAVGLEWQMDQNVNVHTFSGPGSSVTVKTSVSSAGSQTIVLQGISGATQINAGDVFTVKDVYAVNPQNRQSTGKLRKFVVLSNAAVSAGAATVTVWPPMYLSTHALATITAYPQANADVTFITASAANSPQNLVFHRDAFCLGMADLPLPKGVDMAGRISDKQLGLSIRLVRQYDITNDKFPCRLDVLYGWTVLYPQLACRVCG